MVVDTSALIAILHGEPEQRAFNEALAEADSVVMSVASFVEVSIVIDARYGADGLMELDRFLRSARIELAVVDREQGRLARDAFRRFGKGRHPAGLNFGDCFTYALAMALGQPLLFKGEDFGKTDAIAAVQ
jgi:ribonuclease VapC